MKKNKKIKRLSKSEIGSITEFETLPESVVGALNGNCILLDAKDFKSLAYYVNDYILENCEYKKLI